MPNTYRFVETTPAGHLDIVDAETAVHIILWGTAAGFTVVFDSGLNFTVERLYRFTNMSTEPIDFENFDASITDTLVAGSILQATMTDLTSEASDWKLIQHVDHDDYASTYSILCAQATAGTLANLALATDTVLGRAAGLIDDIAVAEQTLLGRITGGHMAGLNAAAVDGIIGSLYAYLAGRAGGQTLKGGTAASESLTLMSTAHGTKGSILFGTSAYDEVNNRLGIGIVAPTVMAHLYGNVDNSATLTNPNAATAGTPILKLHNPNQTANDWVGIKFGVWGATPDAMWIQALANANNDIDLRIGRQHSGEGAFTEYARFDNDGNLGLGLAALGTNAVKVLGIATGTAPTTSPADAVQLYSADLAGVAGLAALCIRSESGAIGSFGRNWLLGGNATMDGTGVGVLQIYNGTAPAAHVDNAIQIFSKDTADNTASLALFTEQAEEDIGATVATKKMKIRWNEVEYWVLLARTV